MLYSSRIVNGDEVRAYNGNGYELVSGKNKLKQDVNMVFNTDVRETTGLGSKLADTVGVDAANPAVMFSPTPFMFEFQMRIKSALDRLKRAQRKFQFVYRVPKELIDDFTPVQIWPIKDDPRNYRWEVNLQTVDGVTTVPFRGKVRV
jgi:hypothetical protein